MSESKTFYVYVLYSSKIGKFYKGLTVDPEKRLQEHNHGKTKSTKNGIPWLMVWCYKCSTLAEARKREKYLKTGAGSRFIKKLLQ